jgi:hypothetical protein
MTTTPSACSITMPAAALGLAPGAYDLRSNQGE